MTGFYMKCNNGLKWCKSNVTTSLTHIMPLVSCYTPLKTSGNVFGCFLGGTEQDQWHELGK